MIRSPLVACADAVFNLLNGCDSSAFFGVLIWENSQEAIVLERPVQVALLIDSENHS
jgi:hypothetical protein